MNPQIDRYTNETTLTNTGYEAVSDDAYQDYFEGQDTGLISKEGAQNDDTENIDWTVTVNEEGLTITILRLRTAYLTIIHTWRIVL